MVHKEEMEPRWDTWKKPCVKYYQGIKITREQRTSNRDLHILNNSTVVDVFRSNQFHFHQLGARREANVPVQVDRMWSGYVSATRDLYRVLCMFVFLAKRQAVSEFIFI